MSVPASARRTIGSIVVSGALVLSVLSGCSSSGGGGGDDQVTQQQIVDKLKNDPRIASAKAQLGNQADKLNKVLDCVAKAMKKDIKQGDLKAYVSGKKTLDDLSGAAKQVTADATTCIKDVVGAS